jgi:hypothetical protein
MLQFLDSAGTELHFVTPRPIFRPIMMMYVVLTRNRQQGTEKN